MNRRSFLFGLGCFTILPGAGRIWKASRSVPNPNYVDAPTDWKWVGILTPSQEFVNGLQELQRTRYLQTVDHFNRLLIPPPNLGETVRAVI